MFIIYWLISENYQNTYVGFSDNLIRRTKEHKDGKVKSTIKFGNFRCFKLEEVKNVTEARNRERYWKSSAGRKKLKECYSKIINNPAPSSSG